MVSEAWLSLSEVANLLGIGLRAVQKNCAAGKYLTRKTKNRNGGGNGGEVYEIALSSLPKQAQKRYSEELRKRLSDAGNAGYRDGLSQELANQMQARHDALVAAQGNQGYIGLKEKGKARADAKLDILDALEKYLKATGQKAAKGLPVFCTDYHRGTISGLDEARATIPELSIPSIYRWQRTMKTQGAAVLAGKYGHRKGSGLIDTQPEIKDYIVAMLAGQPHTSHKNLYRGLRARFAGRHDLTLPALRSVDRWITEWRAANRELASALANPDAWKNQYMVAFGKASADVERLNQRWEMDSTPADVMLTDGRHSIIGVIDVYSRRLKLLVTKTSKSASVALLIRRTIMDWGVPETIKTDNGADYVSNHIRRALRFLGIEQETCEPFQPWQKPHIERGLGTFSHGPIEMMAGFIGHNVSEREAIRARQSFADRLMTKNAVVEINLDAAGLQAYCDQWTDTIYAIEPHEGLNSRSPARMVREWDGPIRVVNDIRALDLLLAEAPGDGYRTVGKKGLRIDRDDYIAPELALYVGQRVHVLYDPEDLGRVYVYADEDGQTKFVCIAECPDRTGVNRQEVAARAKEMQKANIQLGRKQLKDLSKKVRVDQALDEIYEQAAKADNVVRLRPHDTESHTSAGLEAAKEAAEAAGFREQTPAEIVDAVERLEAKRPTLPVRDEPEFDSLYQRIYWLWERTIKGEELKIDEQELIRDFRKLQPRSWRSLDDLLKAKWRDKYLSIRDRCLGLA